MSYLNPNQYRVVRHSPGSPRVEHSYFPSLVEAVYQYGFEEGFEAGDNWYHTSTIWIEVLDPKTGTGEKVDLDFIES